ncbi:hypothetical protein FF38_08821 [Lucilia cuprina]|uniref:Uncharacterized protein n=1 Tax=Lucilia cuprina TaxID=7375 RepID=A0A0L0BQY3_LUCCU|nr:hypothetical protein FF38_08821 [Lucilia cuprina]
MFFYYFANICAVETTYYKPSLSNANINIGLNMIQFFDGNIGSIMGAGISIGHNGGNTFIGALSDGLNRFTGIIHIQSGLNVRKTSKPSNTNCWVAALMSVIISAEVLAATAPHTAISLCMASTVATTFSSSAATQTSFSSRNSSILSTAVST